MKSQFYSQSQQLINFGLYFLPFLFTIFAETS